MSSRDLAWMSLLVKCMLRTKSCILVNNKERLSLLNKGISGVIAEDRRKPAIIGSGDWWKGVDALSQGRRSSSINLDNKFPVHLNDFFTNLCYDDFYVRPVDMDIPDSLKPPKYLSGVCGTLYLIQRKRQQDQITSRTGSGLTVLSYSHLLLLTFGIYRCLLIYGRTLRRGEILTLSPKWTCL